MLLHNFLYLFLLLSLSLGVVFGDNKSCESEGSCPKKRLKRYLGFKQGARVFVSNFNSFPLRSLKSFFLSSLLLSVPCQREGQCDKSEPGLGPRLRIPPELWHSVSAAQAVQSAKEGCSWHPGDDVESPRIRWPCLCPASFLWRLQDGDSEERHFPEALPSRVLVSWWECFFWLPWNDWNTMPFSNPSQHQRNDTNSIPKGDDELYPYLNSNNCEELEKHCPISLMNISPYTDI